MTATWRLILDYVYVFNCHVFRQAAYSEYYPLLLKVNSLNTNIRINGENDCREILRYRSVFSRFAACSIYRVSWKRTVLYDAIWHVNTGNWLRPHDSYSCILLRTSSLIITHFRGNRMISKEFRMRLTTLISSSPFRYPI